LPTVSEVLSLGAELHPARVVSDAGMRQHTKSNTHTTTSEATTVPPAAPAEKRKYSANDQRIAAYVTAAGRFLHTTRTDADIAPIATAHGFTAADLDAGEALVTAAAQAWGVRTEGMGEEDASVAATAAGFKDARADYIQFREIGRANFPDRADRVALGLIGDIAEGFNSFITQATASYTAGKKPPYTEKLSKRSYTPAKLDELLATLDALSDAEADQTESEGAAIGDTAARDEAYEKLKDFMAELKGTLKGALRGQSDLLAKLGL